MASAAPGALRPPHVRGPPPLETLPLIALTGCSRYSAGEGPQSRLRRPRHCQGTGTGQPEPRHIDRRGLSPHEAPGQPATRLPLLPARRRPGTYTRDPALRRTPAALAGPCRRVARTAAGFGFRRTPLHRRTCAAFTGALRKRIGRTRRARHCDPRHEPTKVRSFRDTRTLLGHRLAVASAVCTSRSAGSGGDVGRV